MINGVIYPVERIRVRAPAGRVVTWTDIDYPTEKPTEVVHFSNGDIRGYVQGNFKGEFTAVVSLHEFDILNQSVSERGILGSLPMPVTVIYGAGDGESESIEDTLEIKIGSTKPVIKSNSTSGANEVMREVKGVLTKIPMLNGILAWIDPDGDSG